MMRRCAGAFGAYCRRKVDGTAQSGTQPMKNPWIRKNPLLSIWLSGANTLFGAARGHAAAQARKQSIAMMERSMKQMTDFWLGATQPLPRKRRRKRSR
jgi:hypothetical protein